MAKKTKRRKPSAIVKFFDKFKNPVATLRVTGKSRKKAVARAKRILHDRFKNVRVVTKKNLFGFGKKKATVTTFMKPGKPDGGPPYRLLVGDKFHGQFRTPQIAEAAGIKAGFDVDTSGVHVYKKKK